MTENINNSEINVIKSIPLRILCDGVNDVSPLRDVDILAIVAGHVLVYMNVLGGIGSKVRKLGINNCHRIKDISNLGDIEELNIFCCWSVITFMPHCTSRVFHLPYSNNLMDVSIFSEVWDVCLWECDHIVDVSMLGGVHRPNICFCDGITDI